MKVFISWSGETSQKVACVLRDWLPSVIQHVRPYVSSEDIEKGSRWSTEIAKELAESGYGIVCVTPDNQGAPWINFEAGALSTAMDKTYVTPFLLNMKVTDLAQGPLTQFHATLHEKEDVYKLLESMNGRAATSEQVDSTVIKKSFEMWWPSLNDELVKILENIHISRLPAKVPSRQEVMLEELLEISRSQQRIWSSPENILPPDYLAYALRRESEILRPTLDDFSGRLHEAIVELEEAMQMFSKHPEYASIDKLLTRVHDLYHRAEGRGTVRTRPIREIAANAQAGRSVSDRRKAIK